MFTKNLFKFGALLVVFGVLSFVSTSSLFAQSIDSLTAARDTTQIILQNVALGSQTATALTTIKFKLDPTTAVVGDSVVINPGSDFKFSSADSVTVTVTNTDVGVTFQQSVTGKVGISTTGNLVLKFATVAGTGDTVTVTGAKVIPIASVAANNKTTIDLMGAEIRHGATVIASTGGHYLKELILMPGAFYKVAAGPTPVPTTINAGTGQVVVTSVLQDYFSNTIADTTSSPTAAAVLASDGVSPGNGTLTLTGQYHTAMGTAVQGFTYSKAELIQIKLSGSGGSANTVTITVQATGAANISIALNASYSETITVDQTIVYTVTVTDAFNNPISGSTVVGSEKTPHGGSLTMSGVTNSAGKTTATFTPINSFIGGDTLLFTDGVVQSRVITINPGAVGGIIVDYAGTASGDAITENIAAGVTAYARAFLRDAYGNPVNAASASAVTFSIPTGLLGKNTSLGTAALTTAVTELQYPNSSKTAIGVAIPYTVSSNLRSLSDSVLATSSGYSKILTIQNRSNVPATVKFFQTAGDSSLVASNISNLTTFVDSVWDQYSNLVTAPAATGYTVAPLRSAYKLYLSTLGKAKFKRTADTTAADTLYSTAGYASTTVGSGKTAGVDTIKSWSAASNSVAIPFWVTPAAYAKLVMTPDLDTLAISGKPETFIVEKQDANGNHIDWGLAGANARGNSPSSNFTKPSVGQILTDSTNLSTDTVTTGHNRGGKVVKSTTTGSVGIASVGGSLKLKVVFTPYTADADTQKFYVHLVGGDNDTSTVRSKLTGPLANYLVEIAASDSAKWAGDSVSITITARDAGTNRIYTYAVAGQIIKLNTTAVDPIATKDTTFYFSFVDKNGKYLKRTGSTLADTAFVQGQAIVQLHKFTAEPAKSTITVIGGATRGTTANSTYFKPLDPSLTTTWLVTARDTVSVGQAFSYTITPRDIYYNINTTVQQFATIADNQGGTLDVGGNPKIFTGPMTYNGIQSTETNNLIIFVTNYNGTLIHGQSKPIYARKGVSVETKQGLPTVFALSQNYPNPFNPTTNIKFDIPQNSNVKIMIYDMLGREVATLVNANYAPGHYTVPFNASKLASGMYIYRMTSQSATGDQKLFTSTKKLMLVK